jgi:hypothetical protein
VYRAVRALIGFDLLADSIRVAPALRTAKAAPEY